MYYCCVRNHGPISQGRGSNRHMIYYRGLDDSIRFAKEYSKKHDNTCEIFYCSDLNGWNEDHARKVAAYKKGTNIYFNIR